MTRVQIASEGWGWVADTTGSGVRELAAMPVTFSGVIYDAAVGGSVISSPVTDSRGVIPGWVEEGTYTLTVNGVTQTVQAVSGADTWYPVPTIDDTNNLNAYLLANNETRLRKGIYVISGSGIQVAADTLTLSGSGESGTTGDEGTVLRYTGSGTVIGNSNSAILRRRFKLTDLTVDTRAAQAGHKALVMNNFLEAVVENVHLNGTGAAGTALQLLGTTATYFNRFINLHAVAGVACVDIGDGCNANTWIGGILEGAGIAVKCNPASVQTSECKFIDTAIQTSNAEVLQLGTGAAACRNFEFNCCRFEPATSTLTLGTNGIRIMFLGGTLAGTVTISDSGVENTFLMPSSTLFKLGSVNATAKRTIDLLNANAGITIGNDAAVNLYRSAASRLKTDATLEVAGSVHSFRGGANAMRLTDSGIECTGTNAAQALLIDSKGTGAILLNTANGATGGTKIEVAAGKVGFYGTAPVTKRTLAAAATDAATTQTLANSLRQALIDLGLGA